MSRRTRRHPPRPAPTPLTRPQPPQPPAVPPVGDLVGWPVETIAAEIGADRRQVQMLLYREVAAGRIVELRCGGRVLYARLGGGAITEVPPPQSPVATSAAGIPERNK